jgi:molybdopterin converting factor small subunit
MGVSHLDLDVAEESTPESVFEELSVREPRLAPMRKVLRCAIDQEYSTWDAVLHDGAELALIPPTAGG